jgi:uncharacterized protein YutE (UPF0331/DUF86 family)
MPINKQTIYEKIDQIKEFISFVENMEFDESQLIENMDIQHLVTFRLQHIIELCIDVAMYVIANESLKGTDTAREAFLLLAQNEIISTETADSLAQAAGFRNIIVHTYAKVDYSKVYRSYQQDLVDVKSFIKEILAFVTSRG